MYDFLSFSTQQHYRTDNSLFESKYDYFYLLDFNGFHFRELITFFWRSAAYLTSNVPNIHVHDTGLKQ